MGARELAEKAQKLAEQSETLAAEFADFAQSAASQLAGTQSEFFTLFAVFVLACFVGYYVVWSVTPALHSPLMSVTNAISSVVIVGALIAASPGKGGVSEYLGYAAILLASINIFGGFIVTRRMLAMFQKRSR